MNRPYTSVVMLVALLMVGLVGCGKTDPQVDENEPSSPEVRDTVFDDLVATKKRAKTDVEKAMEVNRQKLDEAMDEQEEGLTQ